MVDSFGKNGIRNKSFSAASLDASWRIAHDQAPSVVGCGATAEEGQNRVFNGRYFYQDPVSHDWWWRRWYNAATASRESQRIVLQHLLIARLRPVLAQAQSARALADRFQMDMRIPEEIDTAPVGSLRLADGDKSIVRGNDGSIEVQLAKPNLANRAQIATRRAISLAQEAVRRYGLDQETPLVLDRLLVAAAGGYSKWVWSA